MCSAFMWTKWYVRIHLFIKAYLCNCEWSKWVERNSYSLCFFIFLFVFPCSIYFCCCLCMKYNVLNSEWISSLLIFVFLFALASSFPRQWSTFYFGKHESHIKFGSSRAVENNRRKFVHFLAHDKLNEPNGQEAKEKYQWAEAIHVLENKVTLLWKMHRNNHEENSIYQLYIVSTTHTYQASFRFLCAFFSFSFLSFAPSFGKKKRQKDILASKQNKSTQ